MKNENRLMIMEWLSKWSDADLTELRHLICEETCNRERKRREAREKWVARQLASFRTNHGEYQRIGDTIVVSALSALHYDKVVMSKATPTKNDKFDLDTGIAVAYAKAIGLRIPDFI